MQPSPSEESQWLVQRSRYSELVRGWWTALPSNQLTFSGTTQVPYYFKGTTSGTATMTADGGTLGQVSQDAVIGVGPAAALAFTSSPQSATAGTCSATPAVVQVRDASGNPVTFSSDNPAVATVHGSTLTIVGAVTFVTSHTS